MMIFAFLGAFAIYLVLKFYDKSQCKRKQKNEILLSISALYFGGFLGMFFSLKNSGNFNNLYYIFLAIVTFYVLGILIYVILSKKIYSKGKEQRNKEIQEESKH